MSKLFILESRDGSTPGNIWTQSACGDTGPGLTQFEDREEAETARRGLVALNEGWTEENTRVRSA